MTISRRDMGVVTGTKVRHIPETGDDIRGRARKLATKLTEEGKRSQEWEKGQPFPLAMLPEEVAPPNLPIAFSRCQESLPEHAP